MIFSDAVTPKTYTVVRNTQLNGVRTSTEFYLYMPRSAMFCDVPQRFLNHAVQAQRDGFVQLNNRILHGAFNLDLLNSREFLAQTSYSGRQSQQLQFGRVQLVAEVLNISCNFPRELPQISKLSFLYSSVRV